MNKLYLGLVHYPVCNKNGQIVTTSVTNLDLHDIGRLAVTFGIEKYFIIQEYEGKLAPYYTTWEMNEEGINNFPCKSIEESISLTEC